MPRVYVRKDPNEVATKWFSMRITPPMAERLDKLAAETGKTKAVIAREVLEKALNQ